jgi:hypothetical protein
VFHTRHRPRGSQKGQLFTHWDYIAGVFKPMTFKIKLGTAEPMYVRQKLLRQKFRIKQQIFLSPISSEQTMPQS